MMKILKKTKKKTENALLSAPRAFKPKVVAGLALGGGGARGFAHIGVLRAFEEHNLDFPIITGTSVGSLVGAMYANGVGYAKMLEVGQNLTEKEIRSSKLFFRPSPSFNIERLVSTVLGNTRIEELPKKFAAIAVDLKTGEEVMLVNGNAAKAVSASCAVPIIFTPVEWENGERLVDGGLSNVIPADAARLLGAEVVVSVDINSSRGSGTESTKMVDTFFAMFRIAMKSTAYKCMMNSDIIIEPDLTSYKSTSFMGAIEMYEEGYRAAVEVIPKIKELLGIKG